MARLRKTLAPPFAELVRARRAAEAVGDSVRAEKFTFKIESDKQYLKDSIKLLRRHVKGFEPDKVPLRKVALLPVSEINRIKKYASIIRQEARNVSGPRTGEPVEHFKIVRPRSRAGREALERFTGQTFIPNRKGYIVPLESKNQRVKMVRKTVTKKDSRGHEYHTRAINIEMTEQIGKRVYHIRYFRFPEQPQSIYHAIQMTREMLPAMPNGDYVLETSNHGIIGDLIPKASIIQFLQARYLVYDKVPQRGESDKRGIAEVLIGFRLMGSTREGAERRYRRHTSQAEKVDKFLKEQRNKRHAAIAKRAKKLGLK